MSVKPTLLVLAAGMGSRYGGLKQMDPMGPSGEFLLDYSVYDALRAGFGKVVFVVRPEIRADFERLVSRRFEGRVEVCLVDQTLDRLPSGYVVPEGRSKPWGTGHAILVAAEAVKEPFCVINGDDFYGARAFELIAKHLSGSSAAGDFSMVAYVLRNTLSEHGSVARGVCTVSDGGLLEGVVERTAIEKDGAGGRFKGDDGAWVGLTGDELVSLNFWGFQPSIFSELEARFKVFLEERIGEEKAEYFIPSVVDELIGEGLAGVEVLTSPDTWFGVTYPQDKEVVVGAIRQLIADGVYPENLWA